MTRIRPTTTITGDAEFPGHGHTPQVPAQRGKLTNSVLEWEPHRRRLLESVDFVDHYLRSHEVGLAKPDPAILEVADSLLGTATSQKILIDDLRPHCATAADLGWLAIHHTNTADTIAQLRSITGA